MKNLVVLVFWNLVLCCPLLLMGCKEKSPAKDSSSAGDGGVSSAALPAALFVAEAPPGARGISEVKADSTMTGEVVVHGRVGGRREPFVNGMAVFLLADSSLKSCNELHGDSCKTPWDYCCEPPPSLSAKTATVQIVGADGKPLTVGMQGQHGIEPLARLTVAGEIASRDAGTLVINARKIYVAPGSG